MIHSSNFRQITDSCNSYGAKLVAVSKTKPFSAIHELYEMGHRDFGENRAQEMEEKQPEGPDDLRWHMIGHLQRNKVKYIAPFVHLIQSIDSMRLLRKVNNEASKLDRTIPVLLQMHIAEESSKFGLDESEVRQILEGEETRNMKHIAIHGLMGMATLTDDEARITREFKGLRKLFESLKRDFFPEDPDFKEVSMGMSGDYQLALDAGSTMIRVGSLIFGERE